MINKKVLLFISLACLLASPLSAQDKAAYRLFDKDGQEVAYASMLEAARHVHVVLFGELHNNPIAHWLQFELSRDLLSVLEGDMVMGAEMFEADDQILINEYFAGHIMERHFKAEAKLWNNYDTDYRPLLELARENQLPFIATNIPRRYAALVHRGGFEALESLSPQALSYIAPLPPPYDPDLPGYRAMLEMEGLPAHGTENFPRAQAIKDATMAHFIMANLPSSGVFVHFHGTYHSNNYEGIAWYLDTYSEGSIRMMTISTVEQDDVSSLDDVHLGLADFIIAVPASMTKTY